MPHQASSATKKWLSSTPLEYIILHKPNTVCIRVCIVLSNHYDDVIKWKHFPCYWPLWAMWRRKARSTLARAIACCLISLSHYFIQCQPSINEVNWQSSEGNFTKDTSSISYKNQIENYLPDISLESLRDQWVDGGFDYASLPRMCIRNTMKVLT